MKRLLILIYSFISYISFLIGFSFLFLLLTNIGIHNMQSDNSVSDISPWLINIALLLLFAFSHSLPARLTFKQSYPLSPAIERNSYVFFSGLVLIFLALYWQPLPGSLWQLPANNSIAIVLNLIGGLGWLICISSTFMVSHSDLYGLRQAWLQWKKQIYTHIPFQMKGFYKLTRHPMMTGFLIAFWFTPDMTSGRLLFNIGMTLYIFWGIYLEENDLRKTLGQDYHNYIQNVPKILPKLFKK
ncbi:MULTISPECIES: NnrU family protein [Providencia]|uniref:NnrU family protein n=1 Tax=Providencia TaxID=586 RepID=UPI0024B14A64